MEQNKKPIKQLYRSGNNRIIFGVCGGLGEYFEIDPIIFRIIFLALTLGGGSGIFIYILLSILIPKEHLTSSGATEDDSNIDLRKRTNGLIAELRDRRLARSRNSWLGWIIVIFGTVLLLDQILPKNFFNWNLLWAILIIAMGFYILTHGGSEEKNAPKEETAVKEEGQEKKYKSNLSVGRLFFGLMFLVIGVAFLIRNMGWITGFYVNLHYFFKFWPVFIIVLGLSFLSRDSRMGSILSVIFVFIVIILLAISLFLPNQNWFLEIWNLVSR